MAQYFKKLKVSQKIFSIFFIVSLLLASVFSGWLQIWHNSLVLHPIPQAKAATTPKFEAGEITISDSLQWTNISLSGTYSSVPVVIATPVTSANCAGTCSGTGSGNGGMYPIPLVRNVTTSGFDISMCIDGGNTACTTGASAETFHYFVFDVDDAANYSWIEAGTTANVDVGGVDTAETYTTSFVATPHVWTQAQTYSQGSNIGAVAWVDDDNTTSGFNYVGCVHTGTGDSCDGTALNETFGYVAIDVANANFDAGTNFQSGMGDISHSAWTAASFSPSYTVPRVMVTQNDDDGGQDPEYAWAQNVTGSGMDFRYCEEDAGNLCNTHTSEKTYWFAVEEPIVAGSITDQLHFRWRNDTTDVNTSGGFLAGEDSNSIPDINKNETYRLRAEVANNGTAIEDAARQYELQWGDKTGLGSCGAISTWVGMSDASDEFDLVDSININPDGESLTPGLLTNSEGYTYVSGEGRDIADTTSLIGPLTNDYYTELEYSFEATSEAITGHNYCFRLYDKNNNEILDSYSVYPELTISSVISETTIMEWGTQASVGDDAWTTVNFSGSYNSPVFICTSDYNNNIGAESDGTADSVVCRVQNVGATSAQVRIQEPGTLVGAAGNLTAEKIYWMVVEEGDYNTAGIKMEAFSYNSTVTDGKTPGWNGQVQSLNQSYVNPVVLGQVMTTNDTGHSQFWAHDGARGVPASGVLYTGKHISEDTDTIRGNETIGVVVIEQANNNLDGTVYESRLQTQTIERIDDVHTNYTFNTAFSSVPSVGIISQAGLSGGDGPYPSLYGASPLSTTNIYPVIMETEIVDTEQSGNTEFVPYIVFESVGSYAAGTISLDQTNYRFFQNADSVQPGTALGSENTVITDVASSDIVRLRMSVQVGLDNLAASAQDFKLQYGEGATCSAIGTWVDIDSAGGGGIWRGYVNATPSDGSSITGSLLNSGANVLESYEEQNNSVNNPAQINDGSRGEWDWVIQNNGATLGTDYCFRMVFSDGSVIKYSEYPKLTTSSTGSTLEQASYRFFENDDGTTVTTELEAENTATTLSSAGQAFKLRTLLHIGVSDLGIGGENFKLQYAVKSGTCDTSFTGETYFDVTAITPIAYNNNATPSDGDNLTENATLDPDHLGHTVVPQTYEELNNFTTVSSVPAGQDGLWGFALIDNSAPANTSYCLRIVKSDDSLLDTYTVVPEITTDAGVTFNQSGYRFFENVDGTTVSSSLAAENTAATLASPDDAFRLRLLMHMDVNDLVIGSKNFKLQYALRSGTCDTGFVGEIYADVTAVTPIAYNNNATPSDGDNLTENATLDPDHLGHTVVPQTYEELNNFTNSTAIVPSGQDGMWDFSLIDFSASSGEVYCLRVVKENDDLLDNYSFIPQISIAISYVVSGTYTSNWFDLGNSSPVQIISWSETVPGGCDIRLQIQTAPDSGGSPGAPTGWYGASGLGTYFTDPLGTLIPAIINGNQWVQYKAELTGDGVSTPILEEVVINYK